MKNVFLVFYHNRNGVSGSSHCAFWTQFTKDPDLASDDNRYVISKYHADPKFNSGMPNTMYGGTIASLIDCHSIWAAMAFAYNNENREFGSAPYLLYVTGKLSVKYIKPTPLDVPVFLKAWIDGDIGRKIRILCELGPKGAVTAAGDTVAVMVKY